MSQADLIKKYVDDAAQKTIDIAKEIWDYAELSYNEYKSSAALSDALREEGFEIEYGIAGMPTAFTATYVSGSGKPVMGLLAEFDALAALSQCAALPEKKPIENGASGHGCGHNLLGAGCYAAAVAVKNYLKDNGKDGTVILYGCPAEEGAGAKQFIARAGYFDKLDFAYTWHPADINEVQSVGSVAIMGANFVFDGIAAHAGNCPQLGRSALDAVELMNVGVNYLREHMIDSARIHYAYSDAGGTAPNVVQGHAVIKYEVRAPKVAQAQELFLRVVDVAKGAALMTGTTMNYEVTMAFSDYQPNKTLAAVMDECLKEIGAPDWTEDDYALATKFMHTHSRTSLNNIREQLEEHFPDINIDDIMQRPLDSAVHPFNPKETRYSGGSTDVGDVGYAVPTAVLNMATCSLGNPPHSWQNTAFSNSEIGFKGMLKAAQVMALSCIRTMDDTELLNKAKAELLKKNGGKYLCPLPDYCTPPIGRY